MAIGRSTFVRGVRQAVDRDGMRGRSTDEQRQLELCQIMWSMRHLVLTVALVQGVVRHGMGADQQLVLVALACQVSAHVTVRSRRHLARPITIADALLLVTFAALGLPTFLVLVMSVGVLGWAATFRPVAAVAAAGVVLVAVATTYVEHGSSMSAAAGLGAFGLLGCIFVIRTVRMNMGARRAAEREQLVEAAIDAIVWESLPDDVDAMKVSAAAERMLGHPVASWRQPGFLRSITHDDDRPVLDRHLTDARDGTVTIRLRNLAGQYRWMEHRATWVNDRAARRGFAVGVLLDVTERVEASQRQHAQARQDDLTGLPNRRALLEALDERLIQSVRRAGAVVILDLDDFKDINDSLGHETGDLLLRQIGQRIVALMGADDLVARLGGDEFAVLLDDTAPSIAAARTRRLVEAINEPVLVGDLRLRVRASAGVVPIPGVADDSICGRANAAELVRCADVAMYLAKGRGSGVELYDPQSDRFDRERLEMVTALERAVSAEQLVLHHQPLFDVSSGRLIGTEALVRWHHPVLGMVPPDQFIPLAEVSGQMKQLTRWVIRRALADLVALGTAGHGLEVSVNLSVRNLYEVDLVDWIAMTLDGFGIEPSRLVVEITESTVMDDQVAAIEAVQGLRDIGVRTWIDDFGTGHSSFARLRTLPVDGVKIDRAFVSGSLTSQSDRIVLRSMVELVGSLGMHTVAEGVEDLGTMTLLREIGCTTAQGFGLARPVTFDGLRQLIEARTSAIDNVTTSMV